MLGSCSITGLSKVSARPTTAAADNQWAPTKKIPYLDNSKVLLQQLIQCAADDANMRYR